MKIAFGQYSFKIRNFNAGDLGLDMEEWGNSKFEVRQKVFHLFWLPLFSLGKTYGLRKGRNLVDLPGSVKMILRAKKVKSPWYSYFVPIIIVVGFIGGGLFIFVAESVMKHQNYSRDKIAYDISITDVQNKLTDLKPNSYLRLVNPHKREKKRLFVKLIHKKDSLLKFQLYKATIPFLRGRDILLGANDNRHIDHHRK